MVVPIVPASLHTTVINKTIVYSDTVLNLKDKGKNLKITAINDVNEYQYKTCIKTVLENNSDVIFNTIQYSKSNKKIYFYTDKAVDIDAWIKRNDRSYKPLASVNEILGEVRKVLANDKPKEEEYISVYDFITVMRKRALEYYNLKRNLYNELYYKIGNSTTDFKFPNFDFKNMELVVECETLFGKGTVIFAKDNGDLYIKKSNTFIADSVLSECGNSISLFYDESLKYNDLESFYNNTIESVNSKFTMKLSYNLITIYIKNMQYDFYIDSRLNSNDFKCVCNSNFLLNSIKNNEEEILRNIFIKISDCHKNVHDILTDIRTKQLIEERKKEKRLKLKKKLLPFLYK